LAEFKVPELGENVAGGDVTSILVKVGDTIAVDQPVLELETDKATVEVPSSVAGRVTDIKVKPGDTVNVGAVVLVVEDGASGESSQKAQGTRPKAQEEDEGEEAKAESPKSESPKAESPKAESPKAESPRAPTEKVVSMPARQAAESKAAPRAEAAEAQATSAFAEGSGETSPGRSANADRPASAGQSGRLRPDPSVGGPKSQAPTSKASKPAAGYAAAPAAPSVRRLAREVGVNIDEVQGSGPDGRISEEDVKEHARRILSSLPSLGGTAAASPGAVAVRPAAPLPDFSRWGEIERQPMSNIRRTTSDRLSHAWTTIPHVTQFDKADITAMEELRKKYREQVTAAGGNLTVTAMLVKVIATAVKQFPQFNASLDPQSNEIIFKKYVNVGVAVDTDRGLLVPVVRNVDRKNITEIAVDVHQLAEKARSRKLTLEEMSGGGITISNLGGIGGTYFTPIVNWPEVAILGVSRGIVESVWRSDKFEPRQLLPLSLSYDHRVIDGADAMRFLRWVVEAIEQPFLLSLLG
jgi:pyruvate dehydrogenase E2 component (dihydrolipoamide acetyltransferase)